MQAYFLFSHRKNEFKRIIDFINWEYALVDKYITFTPVELSDRGEGWPVPGSSNPEYISELYKQGG